MVLLALMSSKFLILLSPLLGEIISTAESLRVTKRAHRFFPMVDQLLLSPQTRASTPVASSAANSSWVKWEENFYRGKAGLDLVPFKMQYRNPLASPTYFSSFRIPRLFGVPKALFEMLSTDLMRTKSDVAANLADNLIDDSDSASSSSSDCIKQNFNPESEPGKTIESEPGKTIRTRTKP